MIVSGVTIPTIIWDGSGNAYDSITISTAGGRPLNWSWGTTVTAGGNTYGMDLANKKIKVLTAIEWNGFCTKVNQFRTYKVLSSVSFTSVAIGDDFLASYFNTVRTAINDMSPPTAVPSSVSAGDKITAAHINGLMTSLNSIL